MPMHHIDTFVLGAGTAGCSFALNLARFHGVLMIDRHPVPQARAGESLIPAANKLLKDMGLWQDFLRQGHLPHHGNRACWGTAFPHETDFMRDPQGHGWHLDRQAFEVWLQQKAVERGAILLTDTRLEHIERASPTHWRIDINKEGKIISFLARVVVDASGRNPALAKRLGAERTAHDNMLCGWIVGKDSSKNTRGMSHIQAAENGWWYSAPVPEDKRIVAFHTDSDNPHITWLRSPDLFLEILNKNAPIKDYIHTQHFEGQTGLLHGTTAANSAYTSPWVGEGWLTVGDAACSFDPLSSQGIFNALYTGLAGAESCYRYLQGEIRDFSGYGERLQSIWEAYLQHLQQWYGEEQRWANAPFWQRRHRA